MIEVQSFIINMAIKNWTEEVNSGYCNSYLMPKMIQLRKLLTLYVLRAWPADGKSDQCALEIQPYVC